MMLPPLCGLNNAPVDAEHVSQVQPEAPSLDDAEAAALGPCEAEFARRGPWPLCNTLSPLPQGLPCVPSPQLRSIARHWPGVSSSPSGHFQPSGLWARGSTPRGRKDSAPSSPCAHLGLEKGSDSARRPLRGQGQRRTGGDTTEVDGVRGDFPQVALTHRQSCLRSTRQMQSLQRLTGPKSWGYDENSY